MEVPLLGFFMTKKNTAAPINITANIITNILIPPFSFLVSIGVINLLYSVESSLYLVLHFRTSLQVYGTVVYGIASLLVIIYCQFVFVKLSFQIQHKYYYRLVLYYCS